MSYDKAETIEIYHNGKKEVSQHLLDIFNTLSNMESESEQISVYSRFGDIYDVVEVKIEDDSSQEESMNNTFYLTPAEFHVLSKVLIQKFALNITNSLDDKENIELESKIGKPSMAMSVDAYYVNEYGFNEQIIASDANSLKSTAHRSNKSYTGLVKIFNHIEQNTPVLQLSDFN